MLGRDRSLAYLNWIRGQNCIVDRRHGTGEPHHLKRVGMGSDRHRPTVRHFSAIPVCRACHITLEGGKASEFCARWRFDPWRVNAPLLARWFWDSGDGDE